LQVFSGLAVPLCASYVIERRHRAVFAHQLRSQLAAQSSTEEAGGPSCTAAAPVEHMVAQDTYSSGRPPPTAKLSTSNSGSVSRVDEGPPPMLADVLVIGAWLPLASVAVWKALEFTVS
jgi:hypothetical protein